MYEVVEDIVTCRTNIILAKQRDSIFIMKLEYAKLNDLNEWLPRTTKQIVKNCFVNILCLGITKNELRYSNLSY